ncbi:MAG TPA: hypothetical protein VFF73_05910 [Planctomycetota bacterium]|nr:hypothetical protein [Planctomycetota bacterium]
MKLGTRTMLGMFLVADAAAFLVAPGAATRLWSGSMCPGWCRRAMRYLDSHRAFARSVATAELLTGVSLLRRSRRLEAVS